MQRMATITDTRYRLHTTDGLPAIADRAYI